MLDLAGIPKTQWPDGLDGYSLKPLMAVAGDEEVVDDRPDFIVSQFHGDNVAMSWFVCVKNGVTNPRTGKQSTFKLIVWGTGAEVPSLLFECVQLPPATFRLAARVLLTLLLPWAVCWRTRWRMRT